MADTVLLSKTITTAESGVASTPLIFNRDNIPEVLTLQFTFTYGSGGTSGDFYVQTSLDDGVTWIDIAQMTVLLASKTRVFSLNSRTPVTTAYTPTDGTLAADTSKDGIFGDRLRIKDTTVGTYAGDTTITIRALFRG